MPQHSPFSFLENSTARALLGTASAATVGPGFLSEALALAPAAPQLISESLRKLSIGNTLADAFGTAQQFLQDSSQQQQPAQQQAPQQASQQATQQSPQQQQLSVRAEWQQWLSQPRSRGQLNEAQSILKSRGLFDEEMRDLWNNAVANASQ